MSEGANRREGLGFVFPGQGSQSVGMLAELGAAEPRVAETFAEASDAVGFDLWSVVSGGPEEELNRTAVTQPALLAASIALWRLWLDRGGASPVLLAGHSLGEYSALVAAGSLSLVDGAALVHARGELMQAAVPEGTGAMAAILGLEDQQVVDCCIEASAGDGRVSPANYNSPGQLVVAGTSDAVDRLIELTKAAGARRALRLAVSVPSHCALMSGAAEALAERLAALDLRMPDIPIVQNVDAAVSTDVAAVRRKLTEQLHQPVRWSDCVAAMGAAGIDTLVECGPGKVLAGLVKRIDKKIAVHAISTSADLASAVAAVGNS